MSYAASLRQQAKWIREALDPATDDLQRIDLGDVDTEELDFAADYIDVLVEALELIANMAPASTEVTLAHNMAEIAENALSSKVSPADRGGAA